MKPTIICEGKNVFLIIVNDNGDEVRYDITLDCIYASIEAVAGVIRECRDTNDLKHMMVDYRTIVLENNRKTRMKFQLI